ncbi:NACHT domain-containing protein [Lentzea aerocolonigenes]|uniref:NACHT domain-containing protein n=1 Tax=Lentzea aerocolonigenes TaxID=68170 RepID=UPI000B14D77C|nr:hypothetical protein [Lentzea aerocolonigenes]MCP2242701.1 hypothetical protein [Lentzea aerocolonigenes]
MPRPPADCSKTQTDAAKPEVVQGRYLYERLGEKPFQQLCGALLAREFPNVTCMPMGQSDGGRDIVRDVPGGRVVYQVKWSANPVRHPVAWLKTALDGEAANIRRLVQEGATEYYLITSVAGTSVPGRGTMDKVDQLLSRYSAEFGIPMRCWWRADLDARLVSAPQELLWSFAEMLAGWDLIRYMSDSPRLHEREELLCDVVTNVVATQWEEDSKVKFKQADMDSYALDDLYVDVEADRVVHPQGTERMGSQRPDLEGVGGAAQYLLTTDRPLTLVHGAPGQGKSTFAQFLCQLHRTAFRAKAVAETNGVVVGEFVVERPRLPLRIDLRDYASWLLGHDPFDFADTSPKKPRRTARSLESFLVRLLQAKGGDLPVGVAEVHDLMARFPLLVVLDGLDEVASAKLREDVVVRIVEFTARLAANRWAPQVVVTTRPNSSGLAEPVGNQFETITLKPLGPELRRSYLSKWADSRGLQTGDRAALERIFETRSAEPHIAQLAGNPMQLTILLYLIQKRGDSIPHARTELYRSYMETFLDREADKTPEVQKHRNDLEEVTAYLGWWFQSQAESTGAGGQLPVREIKRTILSYLYDAAKDTHLVDELFTAVTDRVWALTSKEQGTFRFDVQPVQEYFAANYLYYVAGAEQRQFDASEVFRALVRRPYWFNTCRFYAGFAAVNELAALAEVLEEEVEKSSPPFDTKSLKTLIAHTRVVIWTLLADGVFAARPRTQERVVRLISDDLSVRMIDDALQRRQDLPFMAADRGGSAFVGALREAIAAEPRQPINLIRAKLVACLLPRDEPAAAELWDTWWQSRLSAAAGTSEEIVWLKLGRPARSATHLPDAIASRLTLDSPGAVQAAMEAGLSAPNDSAQASQLLRAVLDGHCSDALPAVYSCEAANVVWLWAPHHFYRKAADELSVVTLATDHPAFIPIAGHQRHAVKRLVAWDPRYERVHEAMKTRHGKRTTTSSWSNTARELAAIHGPSLLGAEIAIIGAALPPDRLKAADDLTEGSHPFGERTDYGLLLREVRLQRLDPAWWTCAFESYPDHLSRATWLLSLLAVADTTVVVECLEHVDEVVSTLPASGLRAVRLASSRMGASGLGRRLHTSVLSQLDGYSADTALLVLHHTVLPGSPDPLDELSDDLLSAMINLEACSWPAVRAAHMRMTLSPSLAVGDLLRLGGPNRYPDAVSSGLPNDVMHDLLTRPADVPVEWLMGAEAQHSATVAQPDLADFAVAEGWFD